MEKIKKTHRANKKQLIKEYVFLILLSVIVFYGARTFIGLPARANGESMYPTIKDNEIVIVNRLAYLFSKPKKNDIIIFPYSMDKSYIKRIIGVEGDEINIFENSIYINGNILSDAYSQDVSSEGDRQYPFIVEKNSYFVLGDNRLASMDSRYSSVGNVKKEKITGRVDIKIYPFKLFSFFGF